MVGTQHVHLTRRPVGLRIPLEMAIEAVGLAFEQRRSPAFARPADDLARSLMNRKEVIAIHGHARNAEPGAPVGKAADGRCIIA